MAPDSSALVPRKKRSVLWWIGGVFLLLVLFFFWQLLGPSPPIVISPQTTYITAPLTADGLPDYGRYVLDRGREGATPENNAAVLLWQALWPGDLEPQHYAVMADELGLDEIPSGDESLQSLWSEKNRDRVWAWLGRTEAEDQPEGQSSFATVDGPWELLDSVVGPAMARPWTSVEIPPLAEWVEENKKPLDLIVEASRRPRYWSPSPSLIDGSGSSLLTMSLTSIQNSREAARALSARAMWNLGEGRPMEAWRDLLAMHRLARLVSQGNTLVEQLVAIAIDGIAADATITLLDHAELTPGQARQIRRDLAGLPDMSSMARSLDQGERLVFLDLVVTAKSGGVAELLSTADDTGRAFQPMDLVSVDWNVLLREGNRWYDRLVAAARVPDRAARSGAWARIDADLRQRESQLRSPGPWVAALLSRQQRSQLAADVLVSLLLPATDAAFRAQDRAMTRSTLERLAAALAVYRADHGAYPERLDELVPDVVAALPVDLYNGQPFIYRRDGEGYLLYSVGENGTDDGGSNKMRGILKGRSSEDLPDEEAVGLREEIPTGADDMAIRVPRPALELPKPQPSAP